MRVGNTQRRRGLSFLEFVGCMVAMTGGVAIGFTYLGIDTQRMAVTLLEQAQVVAPGFFQQVTENLGTSAEKTSDLASSADSTESQPNDSASAAAEIESSASGASEVAPEFTAEERRAATRHYWNGLTECMLAEVKGRLSGDNNSEQRQLYDYLIQRKKGHEEALERLNSLETSGVDERLVAHGEQVIAWNKSAIALFEQSISLISDGPNANLSGPFAQIWQSKSTQLRMEESLVIDRHNAIAHYLDREYPQDAPFKPALGK